MLSRGGEGRIQKSGMEETRPWLSSRQLYAALASTPPAKQKEELLIL